MNRLRLALGLLMVTGLCIGTMWAATAFGIGAW